MKGLDSMNEKYFDYVCYSIISLNFLMDMVSFFL